MEGVQKGTNTLSKIMKQITGSFEGIKTGFLQGFGNITDGGKGLSDTFEKMKKIVMDSIGKAMEGFGLAGGVFDEMSGAGISLGKQLGKKLPGMLETFAKYVGMAIEALPGIWEGIKSFINVMKTVGSVLGVVMKVVSGAITIATNAFNALFSPIDAVKSIFTDVEGETKGFLATLGKLAGLTGLVVLGFKAVSGVLGLFGKSMPAMFANMGKSMMSGAKNMMGGLAGKLNKATGGKLDKVFGSAKDKIAGKAKEMDVGGKAMDAAKTKSKSFTKSLAGGMKDISKGISSMLNNLSKGIGSVITNLAKSVGKAGASLGKGLGDMVRGALTGLGKGLSALGNPKALLGTVVLAALGGAMFIAGKAFQQFADINWAGVGMGMLALGALGIAAALLAPISPLLITGAVAIGALGLALVPFAFAVSLAAPAMVDLMGSFKLLNEVDPKNVLLLGPALVSLAAGMAAFSAGGLVSGILDGLGSLFGSESPFDKLAKIGAAAPAINEMTSNMNSFGTTVGTFNDAMAQLDGAAISGEFSKMAEGIDTLNASMAEISLVSLMKMAAMKSFGPVQQEQEEPLVENSKSPEEGIYDKAMADGSTTLLNDYSADASMPLEKAQEALAKATAAQAKGIMDGINSTDQMSLDSDVQFAQMDVADATKVDKEAATAKPKVDRSIAGRDARRRAAMEAKRDQLPEGQTKGTFVGGKLVNPVAAKTTQPAQANVTMPKTAAATDATTLGEAGESTNKPESNKELFERMVKNQEQTNKLLKSGNRITSDLSDEF